MLVSLRPGGSRAEGRGDAVDDLLACHARIRHFCAVARRLADGPEAEVAEAAAAVHRYFTVALPLHATDEDLSLAPLLRAASPGAEVLDALDAMIGEHAEIEALLAELAPLWSFVAAGEPRGEPLARGLSSGAARLGELFDGHLAPEERILFPAARRLLGPDDLAKLRAEIRARRAPPR